MVYVLACTVVAAAHALGFVCDMAGGDQECFAVVFECARSGEVWGEAIVDVCIGLLCSAEELDKLLLALCCCLLNH